MSDIDSLLGSFPPGQRRALDQTRESIARLLPGAEEVVAWQMPTYRVGTSNVVSVFGFTHHNSVFPHSGEVFTALAEELAEYEVTKGTIHFPVNTRFPTALLRRILKLRIDEINAGFPSRKGEFREYYDNGRLKSKGRMRDNHMVGDWVWYRRDGSMLRSGSFAAGVQVGTWVTYDRTSSPVRSTEF